MESRVGVRRIRKFSTYGVLEWLKTRPFQVPKHLSIQHLKHSRNTQKTDFKYKNKK